MSKRFVINSNYLNFPVKNGAPIRHITCTVDGKPVREFEIELADGKPDFWFVCDTKEFMGQQLRVLIDNIDDHSMLDNIVQGNCIIGSDSLYQEKYRPQFHFSSKRGWINDPNGLVYYKGEYHLFYQHNPYGTKWGNMHWGHAVSKDLLHWIELGDVLYPDETGTMFSGCGIIDTDNTFGLSDNPEEETLILFYTSAGGTSKQSKDSKFTQCIAYSKDGRNFTKYHKNPIIDNIINMNRDPKVVWHKESKQWIMALYMDKNDYAFYTSRDLKNWSELQHYQIQGTGECPDLFELVVDDDPKNKKWVLWSANGSHLIGEFDGHQFFEESRVITESSIETGYSYAAQTWYNLKEDDNRIIQISWATIDIPDMPFNGCMTFPCQLSLRTTEEGICLYRNPIDEIEKLWGKKYLLTSIQLLSGDTISLDQNFELYDLYMEIDIGCAEYIDICLNGLQLNYIVKEQKLSCKDQWAILKKVKNKIRLRFLVDRSIVEIFGNDGAVYMPVSVIGQDRNNLIQFHAGKGDAMISILKIASINSIWS